MGVRIECNVPQLVKKLKGAMDKAIIPAAEQALTDCNLYCRFDTGALRASSETVSDTARGILVWNTPYARRVYYTGTPSTEKNALASLQWCEKAYDNHGEDWRRIAQKAFREAIT